MDLLAGDIAACYGTGLTARVISWGTSWPFAPRGLRLPPSHVAILVPCQRDLVPSGLGWWESTSLCHRPCRLHGRQHDGLQLHDPAERIADYLSRGGRVVIYRLTGGWELTDLDADFLEKSLQDWAVRGVSYDTVGAAFSGTRVWQLLSSFPAADLASLFCSELIADRLMRINRMNHDNPTRYNPGRLLRNLVRQGKYYASHTMHLVEPQVDLVQSDFGRVTYELPRDA